MTTPPKPPYREEDIKAVREANLPRSKSVKLNHNERLVLRVLAGLANYDGDFSYMPFAPIARRTKLSRAEVRRACRSLRRKGLAEFRAGLWTEDGDMAGAGYTANKAGRQLIGDDAIEYEYVE